MLRSLLAGIAALLLIASVPAPAAIRLADSGRVHALTVDADGRALAVVASGDRARPFGLVASRGSGRTVLGTFGLPEAEFPDVAVDPVGHHTVAWARPISGGSALEAAGMGGEPRFLGQATGPPRLTTDAGGGPLLAFPDREGNLALLSDPAAPDGRRAGERPSPYAITASGPGRRHLPLDLVIGPDGPLVLDLVQTRALSELRVVGAGAPTAIVTSIKGVREIPAGVAADPRRIAVAYVSNGRAVLARPRAGGTWSRRRLPGPGGGEDPPAVAIAGGGEVVVVYDQVFPVAGRKRGRRQLFLARVADGTVRHERLTRSRAEDRGPLAAAAESGESYVAWTRTQRGTARRTPLLALLD